MSEVRGAADENIDSADYVVIGGGVHGAACCLELARAGADVVLLERHTIASGASGGLGKRGVRANGRDPRELPLMRLAYDLWPTLADVLDGETGYQRLGGLELAEASTIDDELAWDAVLARVQLQNAHGIPTQILDRPEVLGLEPGLGADVRAAVHCPLDGVADHTTTTRAFATAATRFGATIREGVEVTTLRHEGSHTTIETTSGARIRAQVATLISVNSYAPQLLAGSFGVQLPLWRLAPQVSLVQPIADVGMNHLIGHLSRQLAAKTVNGSSIMLSGGRRGTWDATGDVGVADLAVPTASLVDGVEAFPALSGATLLTTDATRPESCSVDGIPVIDRVPGTNDVYFATGWSGHGFAIAPAVARLLAYWVRSGERPTDLEPFGVRRLGL